MMHLVTLTLPFNVVLVYKEPFENKDDAVKLAELLPGSFTVQEETVIGKELRKIYFPFYGKLRIKDGKLTNDKDQ